MKYKQITAALISVTFLVSGCQSAVPTAEVVEPLTAVEVTTAKPMSIQNELIYAGQIEPQDSRDVVSKMTGKVEETYYEVGDTVNKGDVMFTLDEEDVKDQIRTLNAQLASAQAGVASAQNSLSSVTGGQYESQLLQQQTTIENYDKQKEAAQVSIETAQAAVDNAQLAMDTADTKFKNTKILYDAGTISKAEYDAAETAYNQTVFALEQTNNTLTQAQLSYDQLEFAQKQAEESYDLTTGQVTEENQQKAQMGVESAQASANVIAVQLQIANETLQDTSVRAPMTGVVNTKSVKPGEFTSPQMPAYTIVDSTNVHVDVNVSEAIINDIAVGQDVTLYINSLRADPFIGKIKTISPAADQTSTYPVEIEIPNPDGMIRPGMFAEVHFVKDFKDQAVVLPINAVLETSTEQYVYVNDNGIAKKVVVTTGISDGKNIEITSGITFDQQVVVSGQTYLSDGEAIHVVGVDGTPVEAATPQPTPQPSADSEAK